MNKSREVVAGKMLCDHIKGTLSGEGIVTDDSIQAWVGRLIAIANANAKVYQSRCKAIKIYLVSFLAGTLSELDAEDAAFSYWKIIPYENQIFIPSPDPTDSGGQKPKFLLKDKVINRLIQQDPTNARIITICARLMKLDSALYPQNASRSERDDWIRMITNVSTVPGHINEIIDRWLDDALDCLCKGKRPLSREKMDYLPLISMGNSPRKSKPFMTDRGTFRTGRQNQLGPTYFAKDIILANPVVRRLYDKNPTEFCMRVFTGNIPAESIQIKDLPEIDQESILVSGKILQRGQSGLKLRGIDESMEWINSLQTPLALKLQNLYGKQQGVLDHAACAETVHAELLLNASRGFPETFHAKDSSNFTDTLPWMYQRKILVGLLKRGFIDQYDLDVMDATQELPVVVATGNTDDRPLSQLYIVKYGTGTQQGTRASFPLASIANEVLANIAEMEAIGSPFILESAHIVGDDYVSHECGCLVADTYEYLLNGLGVKTSKVKSISSKYLTEICSKIITPAGVFRQQRVLRLDHQPDIEPENKKQAEIREQVFLLQSKDIIQTWKEKLLHYDPKLVVIKEELSRWPEPFGLSEPIDKDQALNEELDFLTMPVLTVLMETLTKTGTLQEDSLTKESILTAYQRQLNYPELEVKLLSRDVDAIENSFINILKSMYHTDMAKIREQYRASLAKSMRREDLITYVTQTREIIHRAIATGIISEQDVGKYRALTPRFDPKSDRGALYNIIINNIKMSTNYGELINERRFR